MHMTSNRVLFAGSVLFAALASEPARAEPPKIPVPAQDQSAVGARGFFYVAGQYVGEPGKEIMRGQIYVEVVAPKNVRRPYPLVLIHGNAQTPTNWMGTPDGRKGWADFFVEQGYIVYMVEQPMRGRSAWHPSDGATRMFRVDEEERLFTNNVGAGDWPQAKKHTQWPGDAACQLVCALGRPLSKRADSLCFHGSGEFRVSISIAGK
jgi:pimeloyl-ACP methyl ester carboxylesterase